MTTDAWDGMTKEVTIKLVVRRGTICDGEFYAFQICGLKGRYGEDVLACIPESNYPGREAIREFFERGE